MMLIKAMILMMTMIIASIFKELVAVMRSMFQVKAMTVALGAAGEASITLSTDSKYLCVFVVSSLYTACL